MTEQTKFERPVSIDMQENDENRSLVTAIQGDNEDLLTSYTPGLVRLQAPTRLEINRESVEAQLGRPWETHEFQMAIVSLAGNISEWDEDKIVISWGPKVEDDEDEDY